MSVNILVGDVFARLADLPDNSVDCVVTSPPYWGLRDYGVEGQIGLEPTLGEHLDVMLRVFREVRRVLKPSGTLWLNYGDCYAGSWGAQSRGVYDPEGMSAGQIAAAPKATGTGSMSRTPGLKAKDLCMVPNRLAIALQEDGWWVRSEIIWAKPNPMPESITDRPATSHEKIFLLSKSPRYHYDADAVRQNMAAASVARLAQDVAAQKGSHRANGGRKTNGTMKAVGGKRRQDAIAAAASGSSSGRRMAGFNARWEAAEEAGAVKEGRNLRNYEPAPMQVWEIATAAFSEAHFATFPPELAERCLRAGCPAGGVALDPFGGAGTVGLVGDRLGLNVTLIELNPEYAEIARKRIASDAGMFANVEVAA